MLNSQQYLYIVRTASGSVGWGQRRCRDRKLLTWSRCEDKRPPPTQLEHVDDCRHAQDTGWLCWRERCRETFVHVSFCRSASQMQDWGSGLSRACPRPLQRGTAKAFVQESVLKWRTAYSAVPMGYSTYDTYQSVPPVIIKGNYSTLRCPLVFKTMQCKTRKSDKGHYFDNIAFLLITRHEFYYEILSKIGNNWQVQKYLYTCNNFQIKTWNFWVINEVLFSKTFSNNNREKEQLRKENTAQNLFNITT